MPEENSKKTSEPKEGRLTAFPCKTCGNRMVFSPDTQDLVCPYCQSHSPIDAPTIVAPEYIYDPDNDKWDAPDWRALGNRPVSCPACGAEMLLPAEAMTADCPFCGNHYVTELSLDEPIIPPETMTPFLVSEKKARDQFQKWAGHRLMAPVGFRKKLSAMPMSGIYIPAFTYDTDLVTDFSGSGGRRRTEYYTVRVNGKTQTRSRTVIDWFPYHGKCEDMTDDILIPASKKVDSAMFGKVSPFETKNLYVYNPAYLSGFFAERYDVGPSAAFVKAKSVAESRIKEKIEAEGGYDVYRNMSYRHHYKKVTFKHILLPVWFASYTFRKKKYFYLVNGETGRVAGKAPVSPLKIAAVVAASVAAAVLLFFLIGWLCGF